jgi:hypothetical protein
MHEQTTPHLREYQPRDNHGQRRHERQRSQRHLNNNIVMEEQSISHPLFEHPDQPNLNFSTFTQTGTNNRMYAGEELTQ